MTKTLWWTSAAAGVVILLWVGSLFIESRSALKWPKTKGQIISSSLSIKHLPEFIGSNQDPTRWYGADVQYEYSVGDRAYLSNRVSFQWWGIRNPKTALKEMNKYRHQDQVTVYYDPTDPRQAVLEPENVGDILIPLALGALLVFLAFFFLFDHPFEFEARGQDNYLHRGNFYQKRGRFTEALSEFNKIITINPNLVQGYKSRGGLYFQQGEWDKAIADFNKVIAIDPTDAFIYFNRAKAHMSKMQFAIAWEDMHKAMELGFKVKPEILEEIKEGL